MGEWVGKKDKYVPALGVFFQFAITVTTIVYSVIPRITLLAWVNAKITTKCSFIRLYTQKKSNIPVILLSQGHPVIASHMEKHTKY